MNSEQSGTVSKVHDEGLSAFIPSWLEEAEKGRHLDPYLAWSLSTRLRQFFPDGKIPRLALEFLVELQNPYDPATQKWPDNGGALKFEVIEAYASPLPGSPRRGRFLTLRMTVNTTSLDEIIKAVTTLLKFEGPKRLQMGFPRPSLPGATNSLKSGDKQTARAVESPIVIGVLDDACPFGHAALSNPNGRGTRILELWDQSAAFDASQFYGFDYGTRLSQDQLDELIDTYRGPFGVDEEALYMDVRSLQPRLRGCQSHAAAITTLLAGRAVCLPSYPLRAADRADACQDDAADERCQDADDAASLAPIVAVQFPREQVGVAGSRWLAVHVLDGLRFIGAVATRQAAEREATPKPLIVNLSYGGTAGAHDGTAMLEAAMAEIVQAHGSMRLVLAAGNARGTRRPCEDENPLGYVPSGYHALCEELKPAASANFHLYIPPNKSIETYLEIWFENPKIKFDQEQFVPPHEIGICLTDPSGGVLETDQFLNIAVSNDDAKDVTCGLICFPRVAQSTRRSMALIVVAATQTSRVSAISGIWRVTLTNRSKETVWRANAWVERDELPGSDFEGQAARLVNADPENNRAVELTDENTLNNIATGDGVCRVGAWLALGDPSRPSESPYTSMPLKGGPDIDKFAIADETPAKPGIRVSGNISGAVVRMNGTSVAAPQIARGFANQEAASRTAAGPPTPIPPVS